MPRPFPPGSWSSAIRWGTTRLRSSFEPSRFSWWWGPRPSFPRRRGRLVSCARARRARDLGSAKSDHWEVGMNEQYPVRFAVDYPERDLDRLSTGFRIFALIPIAVLLATLSGGEGRFAGGGETQTLAFGGTGLLF